jgi:hypothetical protein
MITDHLPRPGRWIGSPQLGSHDLGAANGAGLTDLELVKDHNCVVLVGCNQHKWGDHVVF